MLGAQNVIVTEDYAVLQLMGRKREINRSSTLMEGWRIQILATTDRSKLDGAKRDFLSKHPGVSIDWIHSKPYYKLRAGAFASKLDATRLLYQLKRDYPSAYPTKDADITPSELLGL